MFVKIKRWRMKRICLFVFLLGWIGISFVSAQDKLTTKNRAAAKLYEEARNFYGLGKITQASNALLQAIDRDKDFIEAHLLLGDIYHNQKDHLKELEILKKAVAIDSTFFPRPILILEWQPLMPAYIPKPLTGSSVSNGVLATSVRPKG